MEFKIWESWLADKKGLEKLKLEGKVLNRERKKMIHKYKQRARSGIIAGYTIPVVNAPSNIASDLLQELSADKPFAASYEDREDKRIWQLRSSGKQGLDVSEIATKYGGGGHKRASGFVTEIQDISI
jgi:nanoRNase/pAp phosphatase (c-di-AMP/oligoRNAs hydrolase)